MGTELIYLKEQTVLGSVNVGNLLEYNGSTWTKYSFNYNVPHKIPNGMYIGNNRVARQGLIYNLSSLVAGKDYHVDENGILTTNSMYNMYKLPYVGFALSSTKFLLNIYHMRSNETLLHYDAGHVINSPIGYLAYYVNAINTWESATDISKISDGIYIGNNTFLLFGYSFIDLSSYILGGLNTSLYTPCYRDINNPERITITLGEAHIGFWVKNQGFYYSKNQTSFRNYGFAEGGGSYLLDCDRYSDVGNSWSSRTDMPSPARGNLAGFNLGSDYGFAAGGYGGAFLQDCDRYSDVGNSWSSRTDMPSPGRYRLSGFSLGSDYGFVMGGFIGSYLQDCDRYNDSGNSWSSRTDMSGGRSDPAGFSLGSDYGFTEGGGCGIVFIYLVNCDRYSDVGNSWSSRTDMPSPGRHFLAGFSLGLDYGFAEGGAGGPGGPAGESYLQDCDRYSDVGNSWSSRTDMPSPARRGLAGFSLGSDYGFAEGGYDDSNHLLDYDCYSDVGNSWTVRTSMPSPARAYLAGFSLQ